MRDVAIAGCGPAGLAAALLLARDGHRVTVFDRFAAPAPVGSGFMLQPTGLAVLRRLGLADALAGSGARIDRLFGLAGTRIVLDVRYAALGRDADAGLGVHRATLFAMLHAAVRDAGVAVEAGRYVTGSYPDGGARRLAFADGTSSRRFDLVVDALGCRSPLAGTIGRTLAYGALWCNLDWPGAPFDAHALEQRYRAASVMAGVLPIGTPPHGTHAQAAFFWSLRRDRLAAWQDAGIATWKHEVERLWPATAALLEQLRDPAQLTFAAYAHRTMRRPVGRAIVHIGDAWHSTSPQLGQGVNMALLDAYALATALRTRGDLDAALDTAVRSRRRHVRLYQAMSHLFTPVYQSDSRLLPLLRDRVVGPLSTRRPATRLQARMVSGLVGGPLGTLGL